MSILFHLTVAFIGVLIGGAIYDFFKEQNAERKRLLALKPKPNNHDWMDDLAMWMATGRKSKATPPASPANTDAGTYRMSGSLTPANRESGFR
jgi:hypothetical protein